MREPETYTLRKEWQNTINLMARIMDVPAGLIMRLNEGNIEVFARSDSPGNPYRQGESEKLAGSGLYCEHVVKHNKTLRVTNALKDSQWQHNPDIKLNMISYLGMPLNYPDGTPFGTICVLDNKENHFNDDFIDLLKQFKQIIESFLAILQQNQQIRYLSEQDCLTGLYNRRTFCELAEKEINRAQRFHKMSCLLMLDIDHFKKINDNHGHQVGDKALIYLANTLINNCRKYDVVGRFGGEEFIIYLPEIQLDDAQKKANQLREIIAGALVCTDPEIRMTLSMGVCQLSPEETLEQAIFRADMALYQAKNAGRNQVVCSQP
jgi:diguanylate cyclase (GGDEF)-like protein